MLTILLVGLFICGAYSAPAEERVIGGVPAKEGEIPYIISLKSFGGHSCGGSILDSRHILTAAHCVNQSPASVLSVQYGVLDSTSKDNTIAVEKFKAHEGFIMGGDYPNDIAIIRLKSDITFGPNVKPTVLPESELKVSGESIPSRLSGWGVSNDGKVQQYLLTAEMPLYNDTICGLYLSLNPYPPNYDPKYHICAGDKNGSLKQCSGDSGGPLYAEGVQHGIVSWSFKPCTIRRPGVFTKVAVHLEWIKRTIAELSET